MLPERRWPCGPRPAGGAASSPARLWLALPPHAAASPSAAAAAPPAHRAEEVEGRETWTETESDRISTQWTQSTRWIQEKDTMKQVQQVMDALTEENK